MLYSSADEESASTSAVPVSCWNARARRGRSEGHLESISGPTVPVPHEGLCCTGTTAVTTGAPPAVLPAEPNTRGPEPKGRRPDRRKREIVWVRHELAVAIGFSAVRFSDRHRGVAPGGGTPRRLGFLGLCCACGFLAGPTQRRASGARRPQCRLTKTQLESTIGQRCLCIPDASQFRSRRNGTARSRNGSACIRKPSTHTNGVASTQMVSRGR